MSHSSTELRLHGDGDMLVVAWVEGELMFRTESPFSEGDSAFLPPEAAEKIIDWLRNHPAP